MSPAARLALFLPALAVLALTGCSDGSADSDKGDPTTRGHERPGVVEVSSGPRAVRLRAAIIAGTRRDFAAATKPPPGFERCFVRRFRAAVTLETLQRLVALEASHGEPAAAQALNRVGVSPADRCGGREHVPELSSAASMLGGAARGLSPDAVPAPTRFVAPEIPLTNCRGPGVGGRDVRVVGMSCADADEIVSSFATAFSDRNLDKELVERGHGWRCYQRIFGGGYSVEETCWRGTDQVFIFKK